MSKSRSRSNSEQHISPGPCLGAEMVRSMVKWKFSLGGKVVHVGRVWRTGLASSGAARWPAGRLVAGWWQAGERWGKRFGG